MLIGGDRGLGKPALIGGFAADLLPGAALVAWGQCAEQASEHEAFGPVLRLLADLPGGPEAPWVLPLLRRCAPSWLVQMPWLLQGGELDELRRGLIGIGTGRKLCEGCAVRVALSQQQPLVLEDLHWSDSATIDLLSFVAQTRVPARLLLLASYQPVEALLRQHPVTAMARRLRAQQGLTELTLQPLAPEQVQAYVTQRLGDTAASRKVATLAQRQSEGHPLFLAGCVEQLVKRGWTARRRRWTQPVNRRPGASCSSARRACCAGPTALPPAPMPSCTMPTAACCTTACPPAADNTCTCKWPGDWNRPGHAGGRGGRAAGPVLRTGRDPPATDAGQPDAGQPRLGPSECAAGLPPGRRAEPVDRQRARQTAGPAGCVHEPHPYRPGRGCTPWPGCTWVAR